MDSFPFAGSSTSPDPFDLGGLGNNLPQSTGAVKKTPQSFLGENSALVNLDNLVSASAIKPAAPTPTSEYYFPISTFILFSLFPNRRKVFLFFHDLTNQIKLKF